MKKEAIKRRYYEHFATFQPYELVPFEKMQSICHAYDVPILTVQSIIKEIIAETQYKLMEIAQEKKLAEALQRYENMKRTKNTDK